jgi:hypothetical protein
MLAAPMSEVGERRDEGGLRCLRRRGAMSESVGTRDAGLAAPGAPRGRRSARERGTRVRRTARGAEGDMSER